MSIQTELTRITNAKAAIKTAIEGKGVTVPDATMLDGMAALIESIEAGGGGGSAEPYAKIITGTHTPAKNETGITFLPDDNLVLRYFILQNEAYTEDSLGNNIIKKICVFRGYPQASRLAYASSSHWSMPNQQGSNQELLVFPGNSNITLYLGAGVTYNWIAVYSDV